MRLMSLPTLQPITLNHIPNSGLQIKIYGHNSVPGSGQLWDKE